jgi:hypothetical protein
MDLCGVSPSCRRRNPLHPLCRPPFPPISPTGCREPRPKGWPRGPFAHAVPCAARPRSPPMSPRTGIRERCCRPSSGAENLSWQVAPRTAGAQQIENGIHRRPHVGLARSPAGRGRRDQRCQPRPFGIPQVAREPFPVAPIIRRCSCVHIVVRRYTEPRHHRESPQRTPCNHLLGQALNTLSNRYLKCNPCR